MDDWICTCLPYILWHDINTKHGRFNTNEGAFIEGKCVLLRGVGKEIHF
jgi:hypothetical protein